MILVHRVIARLNVGGPAMHVVNLAGALNRGDWRTRLVAGRVTDDEGDMAYYARQKGVEPTYLPAMSRLVSPVEDLKSLWRLYRLFRAERPDVVHTHTAKAGTLGRLAALLAGVPVRVHTYHGHVLGGDYFPPWKTRVFLEIERRLARGTHRLVALTRRQVEEMAGELGVAEPERFSVVPLGLELGRFLEVDRRAERTEARRALGLDVDALVVGMVGRMVPIKNHELFLEALAATGEAAEAAAPPVQALIVGSGAREGVLRARADELGVSDRVVWTGWRKDVAPCYVAMDVLALTSHDEGTPVAVLEALAAGVPVVARDVGGVGEVLDDAGVGRLMPVEAGPEAWARALEDPPAVPQEVRRSVVRRYSVERLADDLAALYRGLLAERKPEALSERRRSTP